MDFLLNWLRYCLSYSESQEVADLRQQCERAKTSKKNTSAIIESQIAEINSLKEQNDCLQSDVDSVNAVIDSQQQLIRGLHKAADDLRTEIEKLTASLSASEHEKQLLASLHDLQVERVNQAIAAIGYSYGRPHDAGETAHDS